MKRKLFKKVVVLAGICLMSLPVTANAAEIQKNCNAEITRMTVDAMPTSEEPIVITMKANEPVEVVFPDGHTEVFEYQLNENARATETRAAVTRSIWTSDILLWADAVFENRSVTLGDEAYLDFLGLFTEPTGTATITKKTAREGAYAKARARGSVSFIDAAYRTFDHEMWVDPANSSEAILVINI